MKKDEIALGKEYAVKVRGRYPGDAKQIVRATVVRPEGKRWLIVREGDASPEARTEPVTSQAILQLWTAYCIDTAHDEAIQENRMREWQAEYEAEREAF